MSPLPNRYSNLLFFGMLGVHLPGIGGKTNVV